LLFCRTGTIKNRRSRTRHEPDDGSFVIEPNTSIPLALPSLQQEDHLMADHQNIPKLKTSRQIYEDSMGVHRQVDDGRPRQSEDDMQRAQFGPRGVLGQPDPAKMVPQRKKKTPTDFDPGHTA
jgi:hypothetical protein